MISLLTDATSTLRWPQTAVFAQFTGIWRTQIVHLSAEGSPLREATGDWEFSPALDGRAVLDLWRVPSLTVDADEADREVGLCVRIWDPRLLLWRFTFHSTASSAVIHMYAQQIGDEIVLERAEADRLERWVFHDVRPNSFAWRKDISTRGGPWQTRQTVLARRAPTP